ncbi:MAG: ECF transporter S component [Lachnospiraceae bacterium]|nr:ECF transporter S component [Lachnospiraceae bacterium]
MKRFTTKKLVLGALFAALTCICTMVITIPTPTGGYVHAGDCFVILSGILLGSLSGGLSAGIGSMFADLFLGYTAYAPGTFLIKFMAAFLAAGIYRQAQRISSTHKMRLFPILSAGIISSIVVIAGYFLYDWFLTGNTLTAAISSIFGNSMQGLTSIVLSALFYLVIPKNIWRMLNSREDS